MRKNREFNPKIELTRKPRSPYRIRYVDKNLYDDITINIHYEGQVILAYEIDAINLPDGDSIHFRATPSGTSFNICWYPKDIESYLRRIK